MRRSKYGAVPTVVDGITFASKREARRWQELQLLEKAGEIRHLRRQVPFELHAGLERVLIGRYVSDATYDEVTIGAPVYVVEDSKGVRTALYRWKKKHVEAEYGITIREV